MRSIARVWYLFFFFFGFLVLGFSILKVRGLSPEKWISLRKEEDVYGELEYLRDHWDWGVQLGKDRWAFWTVRDDSKKAEVLFGFSKTRADRAKSVFSEGHWFLSLHMRRKGSIYALEAMKFLESGHKDGTVGMETVVKWRAEIERQLMELDGFKSDRQDLRDIENNVRENLEIVLKQLKAIENS